MKEKFYAFIFYVYFFVYLERDAGDDAVLALAGRRQRRLRVDAFGAADVETVAQNAVGGRTRHFGPGRRLQELEHGVATSTAAAAAAATAAAADERLARRARVVELEVVAGALRGRTGAVVAGRGLVFFVVVVIVVVVVVDDVVVVVGGRRRRVDGGRRRMAAAAAAPRRQRVARAQRLGQRRVDGLRPSRRPRRRRRGVGAGQRVAVQRLHQRLGLASRLLPQAVGGQDFGTAHERQQRRRLFQVDGTGHRSQQPLAWLVRRYAKPRRAPVPHFKKKKKKKKKLRSRFQFWRSSR